MSHLVIVESPAKAKTINKYLGNDFLVTASFGHVRDLPKSKLGVDVENDFEPSYIVAPKSKKVLNGLKKLILKSELVYLATDPDREGEAISWHILEACNLKGQKAKRITFAEISEEAVLSAIKAPRDIDMNLVDAQQARRVLDRLVGYNLSPLLWKKVMRGLSAGRVQSVAVRMVVEREREIGAFSAQEYWSIVAILEEKKIKFEARLIERDGKRIDKLDLKTQKEAEDILKKLESGKYKVESVEQKKERRQPPPPFTTSTLQQEASSQLGFSAKQTMRLAQGLYEDGHITYMRTDSFNISQAAIASIRKFITTQYGEKMVSPQARVYKTKAKSAQEAHEAIRPVYADKTPDQLKAGLDARQAKLYELIWKRAIATQMSEAVLEIIEAKIKNGEFKFIARGQSIDFAGWLTLYPKKVSQTSIPELKVGDEPNLVELVKEQHFTEPPARYSEATLIKALEEQGIGRPSTYAPTMGTIQDRGYVVKERGRLKPEKIGIVVNDILVENFEDIVNYGFTARIEGELDEIAEGKLKWREVVAKFYGPFSQNLEDRSDKIEKQNMDEDLGESCPDCGKNLIIKHSRNGRFIGCAGFPDCRYTRSYVTEEAQAKIDAANESIKERKCPKCKSELKVVNGKFGPFIGCSKYPECKYIEKIAKVSNNQETITKQISN